MVIYLWQSKLTHMVALVLTLTEDSNGLISKTDWCFLKVGWVSYSPP